MKKLILAVALLASPALAQDKPAAFVPITLSESDVKDFQKFLEDQPYKIAAPLLQWMGTLQQRANAEAAAKAKADTKQ